MAQHAVNVLQCRSHLVWLVFEGSITTCACFNSENLFVTLYIDLTAIYHSNPRPIYYGWHGLMNEECNNTSPQDTALFLSSHIL